MDDQDTQATEPTSPDRARDVADSNGRKDDRNDEVAGSPAPDPTEEHADDVPEAD